MKTKQEREDEAIRQDALEALAQEIARWRTELNPNEAVN